MLTQKRILICPLDWGLGHATRCIPVIRLLLQHQAEVFIAGDGASLQLLKQEFPQLKFIHLKGYNICYSKRLNMVVNMLLCIPKIVFRIYKEHYDLKKIIRDYRIDVVVSDNRYGLWNKNVKTIFITHQLMIKSPFAERLLHRAVLYFVSKYNECWVPDNAGDNNYSGDLSHKYTLPENAFFVGILSRFTAAGNKTTDTVYDVLAIVSGLEPQRSVFEAILIDQLKDASLKSIVICGKPQSDKQEYVIGNVTIMQHAASDDMHEIIEQSNIIIARSGYSTVMDLASLGKKAVFVPTPGQTEQEYLADYLMYNNIAYTQHQQEFDLKKSLTKSVLYRGFKPQLQGDLLECRIKKLL